jgi:hypothetical protein
MAQFFSHRVLTGSPVVTPKEGGSGFSDLPGDDGSLVFAVRKQPCGLEGERTKSPSKQQVSKQKKTVRDNWKGAQDRPSLCLLF